MKRKLSMILTLSVTLTMLTACNKNEKGQSEFDPNISVSTITSYVSVETKATKELSASEEIYTESTSNEFIESIETDATSIIEHENIEMPVPFENEGGDLNADFYSTVNLKLGYIDMSFVNLVGVDEFENWLNSTSSSLSELTSVGETANLYSFIKHFDVSSDFVRENLVNMRNGSADDFTDDEIDLITSDNDEAVAAHFVADTAILKGSDIYSLKWIYNHSIEDYAAAGITTAELEAALPMFDKLTLTEEARQAIEMKITSYAAVSK